MDFLIATHNMKKRDELSRILKPVGVRALLAEEAGVDLTDVEETGTTFEENAFLKAQSGCLERRLMRSTEHPGFFRHAIQVNTATMTKTMNCCLRTLKMFPWNGALHVSYRLSAVFSPTAEELQSEENARAK